MHTPARISVMSCPRLDMSGFCDDVTRVKCDTASSAGIMAFAAATASSSCSIRACHLPRSAADEPIIAVGILRKTPRSCRMMARCSSSRT
jgi:hypothetical protein